MYCDLSEVRVAILFPLLVTMDTHIIDGTEGTSFQSQYVL